MSKWKVNSGGVEIDDTWMEKNVVSIPGFIKNIVQTYEQTIEYDKENGTNLYAEGLRWYEEKHRFCEQIALETGVEVKRVIYALAVTSNNVTFARQEKVHKNYILHVLAGKDPGEFRQGLMPVFSRKGGEIILWGNYSACSGPKVSIFAENLCGNYDVVTIDRHAVRIALQRKTDDNETTKWVLPQRRRLTIEAAYHEAARLLDVKVAGLQACTWVYVTKDRKHQYQEST